MPTDAEHKEMIVELMRGKRPMDWKVWPAFIHDSQFLTPEGKNAVLWARDVLQCTLGDNFIQQIEKRAIQLVNAVPSEQVWPSDVSTCPPM